jgi:hypothetical protein
LKNYFEGPTNVGTTIFREEELQFALQFLLPPPTHHGFRITDGVRETRFWQQQLLGHCPVVAATVVHYQKRNLIAC